MSRPTMAVATALLGLFAATIAATNLPGQQPAQQHPPLAYRRIFVPQQELETQIKGLLPVKREEFEQRVAGANKTDAAAASSPRISRARYTARLSGQQLVEGEAHLEIAASQGSAGTLTLEPCNLALGPAQWEETPPRRAVLGIGPRDVLTLQVDKPGTALIPWTRRGRPTQEGVTEIDLEFPPAAIQELRLRLSKQLQLTAEPGLVSRTEQPAGDAEWLVELGGMSRVKLRIQDTTRFQTAANLTLLKEQVRYALTPTDVTADFQLQADVHGSALPAAQFVVDPRMKVTAVSVGSQTVPWLLAGDEKNRTMSVEFPEPLPAGTHNISIQAVSPFAPGRPYRLPRIAWQGAVWQEGSATLSVPPSMQIAVSRTSACRASKGVPPGAGGESLGFQYHAADGYVEIEAGPRRPRMSVASGVTVRFDAKQATASLRADLVSQEGEAFEVDALVSNEWIIDSVETVPADLLEDRPVVAQDEQTRTIRLKFQQPITPQRPARLVVRARLQRWTPELSAEALWRWFRLKGVIERPAVMALRNNIANYDLQVAGDVNAVRLDPEASSSEELALLDAPPSGLLFRLSPEASDFQVLLREGEPRYAAAWYVTCACSRSRLRQSATVRCVPSGPGLSRLMIHSSPPPDREIRWRVTGVSDATIVAQTRRDTSPSPTNPVAGAVWELELSRPLAQPFGLETTWETPREPSQAVALFTCPDASTQNAVVRVTAEDDSRWSLTARGLAALPILAENAEQFTSNRGLFRYEPGRQASLTITQAGTEERLPLARVQAAELTTRFAADASALHVLSLTLENTGLIEFPVRLPSAATLQEVTVGGRSLEPLAAGSQPGQFRIPLPAGERHVPVRIVYATTAQSRPIYVRAWKARLPELSVAAPPVAWHVALPPGVRAAAGENATSWDQQLRARFWGSILDGQAWTRWLHPWRKDGFQAAATAAGNPATSELMAPSSPLPVDPGWVLLSRIEPWSAALSLEVCEPARCALFTLILALSSAALVLLAPRGWLGAWLLVAVGLATAVLTVPILAAPLVAGAFWGVFAGGMAALLRPAGARSPSQHASRATTTRWLAGAGGVATLLVAALLSGSAEQSLAAPPDTNGRSENQTVATHRVVIPIDDDRKPTGEYLYVDDGLYEWLLGPSASGMPAEAWQLHSAAYEIRWPNLEGGGPPAAEIRASLEIESSAADTPVALPFRRQQVLLQQGGVKLDGIPLATSWREDGKGLTAVVPLSGKCRLDLSFSAPLKDSGDQRELALAIPRAARATALVSFPPGAAPPISTTSLGSQVARTNETGSELQIDLGATAELTLRTGVPSAPNQDSQAVEAEQLLWWRVRPGSVVVDAAIKFRPLTGFLRQVQLRFDPHLRLLALEGLPPGARHRVEAGETNSLHVDFSEPVAGDVVIRPHFLLAEASGIGKVVPPRLEPVASRLSRHWMAVTAGPGLELVLPQQPPTRVSPAEFAQAAGVAGTLPQAAFDLAAAPTIAELEFRPETRAASAISETTVYCGLRLCRLRFQADLTDLAPQHLQQRISLPPGWAATQVVVRDGDLPIRSRWFQEADGTVVVRLDQTPGSSQQLQIDAVLSPARGAPIVLPAIELLEASESGSTLKVIRSYDCSVQVTETAGWATDEGAAIDRPQEGLGRLVASLHGRDGVTRRQLTMQIVPNRPQVSARLVTRYSAPATAAAEIVVACELEIADGKLDAVRMEGPPEWSGPLETSPPLTVHNILVPGQTRRHLTLIPDLPLTGRTLLVIRAPLRPTAGESLRVPDITLLDVPRVERFVQLPKASANDSPRWQVAGLQSAPLPVELRNGPLAEGDYETLVVASPHFDAVLATADAPSVAPLVSLAEYRVAWRPPGIVQGEAIFHLDAGGMESCALAFPDGTKPTFATLDGSPAEIVRDSGGGWNLRLPSDRLPKMLVIGFQGQLQNVRGSLVLTGPTLASLKAQATIWSVDLPASFTAAGSVLSDDGEILRLDQDLLRLASAVDILGRAGQRDHTGLSSEAMAEWLEPWRMETAAASQRARAALQALVNDAGNREAAFRNLETQLNRIWQSDAWRQQSIPPITPKALAYMVPEESRRLGGTFRDQHPQVDITLVEPGASGHSQRSGAAVLVLIVGALGWLLARWSAVGDWLAASGPFLLTAGGIVLAWLSPLGLAALGIALVALWVTWRPPWPNRNGERHSSVVALARRSRSTS